MSLKETKPKKEQNLVPKFKDINFLKGISTVIGASLINFFIGEIFSLCTLVVYELSYIKRIDNSITIDHMTFYYPTEIFFQCFFSFISGILYKKLGLHSTNLIGIVTIILGHYIMYLSSSLYYDIISIIFAGSGIGIIYYPSTTNACEWFMEHNGIIIGILETMISFGSFCFSLIGERIINKEKIQSHFDDNLYDFEIGKRMKCYLVFLIMCSISIYIISFLLMFDKKIDNNNDKESKEIENSNDLIELEERLDINNENESDEKKTEKEIELIVKEEKNKINSKKSEYKKMLIISGKSKRLLLFCLISVLQFPVPAMIFSLYRGIGEYKKIDMNYLQLIGSVNFIFEGLSGFIFGILCDYVNLKYLLLFINGVDTLIAFSYYYTFNNSFIYFFITSFTSFSAGGYYPFKDCYLLKVFGTFIYIELSSYVSFLKSFVVTIISPIAYYIETKVEIKDNAYWILFMTLAAMNLIATILGLFINDSPFNYKEKIKKRKKYEEENI